MIQWNIITRGIRSNLKAFALIITTIIEKTRQLRGKKRHEKENPDN